MTISETLVCPRCSGRMRPYERSGIPVDECEDCRGIFLDRGELERLIDAEGGGWSGRIIPPAVERPRQAPGAGHARFGEGIPVGERAAGHDRHRPRG